MPQIDLEPEHYRDTTPLRRRWGQIALAGLTIAIAAGWIAIVWLGREQPVLVVMASTIAIILLAAAVFIGAWLRGFE